jgi:hypothetical protein
VGDSSTTSYSTIKAQKDAEDKWGRGGAYVSLALDPCHDASCVARRVLVCQCQISTARSKIANCLSSSIATADQIRVEDILGRKTVVVNALHPSTFLRSNWANDVEKDDL